VRDVSAMATSPAGATIALAGLCGQGRGREALDMCTTKVTRLQVVLCLVSLVLVSLEAST
jgi:hypothetical protein